MSSIFFDSFNVIIFDSFDLSSLKYLKELISGEVTKIHTQN